MTGGNQDTSAQQNLRGANDVIADAVGNSGGAAAVDTVRHGSPYVSPALRTSLVSPNSRESTPTHRHRVTVESLLRRPRSNPRTRTPMRYESGIPAAFQRDEASPERREGQRITVRPLAGAPVGTTFGARRIHEIREGRAVTPLSSKQGPGRRKERRWKNDSFSGIASELANASSRGAAAADVLLQAKADAPLYVSVYNPADCPESTVSKFMVTDDAEMKGIRNEFFEGEIGYGTSLSHSRTATVTVNKTLTPEQMLKRIPERLRNVLIRACSSSQDTIDIVNAYEQFLVQSFVEGKAAALPTDVASSLVEAPLVTQTKGGSTVARFCFDSESSAGGFHRLLLHAVCQFHCLNAVSKTVEQAETQSARLLTVTGSLVGSNVQLHQTLHDQNKMSEEATKSLSTQFRRKLTV